VRNHRYQRPEPDDNDDGAPVSTVVVPPSDLHQQLSDLLWKQKHGADVIIDVAGETFEAWRRGRRCWKRSCSR